MDDNDPNETMNQNPTGNPTNQASATTPTPETDYSAQAPNIEPEPPVHGDSPTNPFTNSHSDADHSNDSKPQKHSIITLIGLIFSGVAIVTLVVTMIFNAGAVATFVYDNLLISWSIVVAFLLVAATLILWSQKPLYRLIAIIIAILLYASGFWWVSPLAYQHGIPLLTKAYQDQSSNEQTKEIASKYKFDTYDLSYAKTLFSGDSRVSPDATSDGEAIYQQTYYRGHITFSDISGFDSPEILTISEEPIKSTLASEICGDDTPSDTSQTCQIIGKNSSGSDIIVGKPMFDTIYGTDIGNTRITITLAQDSTVSVSQDDIIKLLNSTTPLDPTTIKYSKIEQL